MQQWTDKPSAPSTPATPAGFCDGCGEALAAGTRFCTACGRPRENRCFWCNESLPVAARLCPVCGRAYRRKSIAGHPIAGFGFRAGVFFIDGFIASTVGSILQRVMGIQTGTVVIWSTDSGLQSLSPEETEALWFVVSWVILMVILQCIWNSLGWSPAQRMIGLRIIDTKGRAPGWGRGLGRTAASWLSALALGLGYLAAAWHPEKRTWHDRTAGTWVVDIRDRR